MAIQRIGVTGMAWLTALGGDLETAWQALLAGQSGLRPVPFVGRVRNLLAGPVGEREDPPSERLVKMACQTIRRALSAAGREPNDPDVRLVLGTSLGAFLDDETSRQSLGDWAARIARGLAMASAPIVVSTACSSGSGSSRACGTRRPRRWDPASG